MTETGKQTKDKIIGEFETMKSFELTAKNLYARIAADPDLRQKKVKDAFASLAKDEQRHAEIVQEIIDIIRKTL